MEEFFQCSFHEADRTLSLMSCKDKISKVDTFLPKKLKKGEFGSYWNISPVGY